jgi:hypothetical protein
MIMSGYVTAPWSDFGVAVVGAAAALTGLLFVAVSLNIERILAADSLAGRSGSTLILFVIPLVVGIVVLVPDQPTTALGVEVIATGIAAGAGLLWLNRPANRGTLEPRASWLLLRFGTSVSIPTCLMVSGVSVLVGAGGGLYWIAPAVVAAFLGGLTTVWGNSSVTPRCRHGTR